MRNETNKLDKKWKIYIEKFILKKVEKILLFFKNNFSEQIGFFFCEIPLAFHFTLSQIRKF